MAVSIKSCRALVSAILVQAFSDALSRDSRNAYNTAIEFIDKNNPLFIYYCGLLSIDPEYTADTMQYQLRQHKLKSLKKLRN